MEIDQDGYNKRFMIEMNELSITTTQSISAWMNYEFYYVFMQIVFQMAKIRFLKLNAKHLTFNKKKATKNLKENKKYVC